MKQVLNLMLAVALTPGMVGVAASAADYGPGCVVVAGTIEGVSVPRFDGDALAGFDVTVTEVSGPLSGGEITASLTITHFLEDGSLVFDGRHHFTGTQVGTFSTADHGLTSADGRVGDLLTIDEGGSGYLLTMGNVNLETGQLALDYTGVVCSENENPEDSPAGSLD